MKKLSLVLISLSVWLYGTGFSHADLIFTSTMHADFEFEVVEGPFSAVDGLNVGDVLTFRAVGSLEFTLDDSVHGATSMAFTNVTGTLTGVSPESFMPFEITPDVEFDGGSLNDIVRNSEGQIVSAAVVDLRMMWEMFGNPAILGGAEVLLYSVDSLDFNGQISAVPFAEGDMLVGPNDFEVYLDLGLGSPGLPGGDPLAAIGRNRSLTAVPEPSSMALFVIAFSVVAVRRRSLN